MPKIEIKGDIVDNDTAVIYRWWGYDSTSPGKVNRQLTEANGEPVTIEINSPGGHVDAGSEIYTALKNYPGHVTVEVVGLAASAASVIAMAGDEVKISPTAEIMIHNAWMTTSGDKNSKSKDAKVLSSTDEGLVNAYEIKTGKSREELLALMDEETWMNAQQAVELGFADEIMFTGTRRLVASNQMKLSLEMIEKTKELMEKSAVETPEEPKQKSLLEKLRKGE